MIFKTSTLAAMLPGSIPATSSATVLYTNNQIEAVISKENPVYKNNLPDPSLVVECGPLTGGSSLAETQSDESGSWIRLTTKNQRNCLSFGLAGLPHLYGYLVSVESRHIRGRQLQFGLINHTAKHVETEALLPAETNWTTSYFILPPLAFDGIGYDTYIINDAIGSNETVNDLREIKVWRIPYDDLVSLKYTPPNADGYSPQLITHNSSLTTQISHPNPAEYRVIIKSDKREVTSDKETLILSQSFHPGWLAYRIKNYDLGFMNWLSRLFPYIFGERLTNHVMVNNWSNGWLLEPTTYLSTVASAKVDNSPPTTIYLLFWPQILEFLGFAILPLPLLFVLKKHISKSG